MPTESFENGNANGWDVNNGSVTSSTASDGTYSFRNNKNASDGVYILKRSIDSNVDPTPTATFAYRETSNSRGVLCEFRNGNNDRILELYTLNPQVGFESGNGHSEIKSNPSPDYDNWRRFTITFDWQNETFDLLWEDLTGYTSNVTRSNKPFINSASGIGETWIGNGRNDESGGNADPTGNEWVDEVFYPVGITEPSQPQNVSVYQI